MLPPRIIPALLFDAAVVFLFACSGRVTKNLVLILRELRFKEDYSSRKQV